MNKLPVFRTYGNALGFALGSFFTAFRLTWLPLAAWLGATFALGYAIEQTVLPPDFTKNPDEASVAFGKGLQLIVVMQIALTIIQVMIFAIVAVALHRVILFDERKPGEYFNFPFGATEFTYILMGIASFVLSLAIIAAVMTPILYFATGGDLVGFFESFKNWPDNMPNLAAGGVMGPLAIGYVAGLLLVIYVAVRLAVWPAAVVAKRRFSPGEAWSLTRGNFWRFIGLFLLIVITIWLAVGLPAAAYYYQIMREAAEAAQTKEPLDADALRARWEAYAPLIWFGYLVFYVFTSALSVALVSYAYKALKGYDARSPIPAEG